MRLVVLGVGNAFSADWYSSCYAIVAGEEWILFDCPHPIRKIVQEGSRGAGVPLPFERLRGVFLSHLHADHVSGLEGLAYYFAYVLGKKLPLLTHRDIGASLWNCTLAGGMEWSRSQTDLKPVRRNFDDFFATTWLDEATPTAVGPFRVECRQTLHNIPTIAGRIHAGGKCIGLSADTAFDPALIDWLAACDLIVHEAGGPFLHTPLEKLATLPESIRRKMRITHYRDDFDVANSPVAALRQGQAIEV
ncbi:MAG: MBL fold metallo-hydrolase [Gemmataceae bacterium]|nr:MBL fold metallo-hydrolase [Gemmataceae bacterium]